MKTNRRGGEEGGYDRVIIPPLHPLSGFIRPLTPKGASDDRSGRERVDGHSLTHMHIQWGPQVSDHQ